MEDKTVRTLLALRQDMDKELTRLRERIMEVEEFIRALDAVIGARSFATADTTVQAPTTARQHTGTATPTTPQITTAGEGFPRTIPIMSRDKKLLLATMEVHPDRIVILPAPDAMYDIKRGPFARFFMERILGGFQQEDRHAVETGLLEWDDAFSFDVSADDGVLKEVLIRNYHDEARVAEIERTLRWALEKIYVPR